jgi:hypothetical protein
MTQPPATAGDTSPTTAAEWTARGNEYLRRQQWKESLDSYTQAIALDAQSPAVELRRMVIDILNFYHKDRYNP